MPPWPKPRRGEATAPGEWRRLHCALLKGSTGLTWFLVTAWRRDRLLNPMAD
ncbi:unnamed protein product [Polarella glacialis]|uniref:Uncharacterized protein n=1 Tax=Polarella glacialis TaxID=89957 RepID=A0A813KB50_POLGL|nr:unnamed protein product [Polarella glacialis]CAE8699616.1 unnamed protein product [Polarella glacialis]